MFILNGKPNSVLRFSNLTVSPTAPYCTAFLLAILGGPFMSTAASAVTSGKPRAEARQR